MSYYFFLIFLIVLYGYKKEIVYNFKILWTYYSLRSEITVGDFILT
jgi:hypothetical protein